MLKRLFFFFPIFFMMGLGLFAQNEDKILFTVADKPVQLSEFEYIYNKTNGEKADYSKASLDEYLDLYVKFKLKVEKAKELKLDTIPALQKELAGYRRQLANSYLVDKEVTEKLVKEAFDRTKKDVEVNHIMISLSPDATSDVVAEATKKINDIKALLDKGGDFKALAKQYSEDTYSKDNGGRLGFFVAMFREGFYEMESAAYNLKVGEYSAPIRTAVGLHIVQLQSTRPARGEVEVAHILIRNDAKNPKSPTSKTKIDSLYQVLKKGGDFEALAKAHSMHAQTKMKGGYIGFTSTNSPVEEKFKDAAFSITKDEAYSEPFQSSVGWHIIRRISRKTDESYDVVKRRLQTKIQKNARGRASKFSRQEIAKQAMFARIKREGNFVENTVIKESYFGALDSTYVSHRWKKTTDNDQTIFSFGKKMKFTVNDFADYSKRSSSRMKGGRKANPREIADLVYDEFIRESALKFEESQLETKYPEFKSLMREYEEGILLFEATKILVWDKASQDSVGLKAFHATQKDKYKWDERAVVYNYTLRAGNDDQLKALTSAAAKMDPEKVLAQFNTAENQILTYQEKTYEKGKNDALKSTPWRKGAVSSVNINNRNKASSFMVIKEILPPGEKTLAEARGYVIANYQDFLEKKWLKELKETYPVNINKIVFKSLIK